MELFNKITKWISEKKKKFVCLVLLAFFVPIFLVLFIYSIPSLIPSYVSPLSAGDLLGYYASFVATLGTVTLGLIAAMQSQIINELSIKANEPDLAYRCVSVDSTFSLSIKNRSENITRFPTLYEASLFPKHVKAPKIELKLDNNNVDLLKENNVLDVKLNYGKGKIPSKFILVANLNYQDKLGLHYNKKITFECDNGKFSDVILIEDEPKKKLLSGGKIQIRKQSDFDK